MTPAELLAGVLILIVALPLSLRILGHRIRGVKRLHIKISLLPPCIDVTVEHRSD